MRVAKLVQIALVVAFIGGPFLSVMLFGYDASSRDAPSFQGFLSPRMLEGDGKYRNETANGIITASPMGSAAIRAKSFLDYEVLGFVNTKQVISGKDGWLFYKQQFGRACLSNAKIVAALDQMEILRAVAAGAGIDLRFSVSPDKSVVYPEQLGRRGSAFAGCKLESAAAWRNEALKRPGLVIDHLSSLASAPAGAKTYFATDTHWNSFGRSLIVRQLAQTYLGIELPLPESGDAAPIADIRDLMRMLHLRIPEEDTPRTNIMGGDYRRGLGGGVPGETVIVHDSFYNGSKPEIRAVFPNSQMFRLGRESGLAEAIGAAPEHILINSVERELFGRLLDTDFSWNGELAHALLKLNSERARCRWSAAANSEVTTRHMERNSGAEWSVDGDPQILIRMPAALEGQICLRVTFESKEPAIGEIFLPDLRGSGRYRGSLKTRHIFENAHKTITLALPTRYSGSTIRVDPVSKPGTIRGLSVEVGRTVSRSGTESVEGGKDK